MIVSMIRFIIEIPQATSLKEKRKVVKSLKDRIMRRFRISAAEVDLLDSITFSQIGCALVSNSKQFGESIMQKVLTFVEDEEGARLYDVQIMSEMF